MDANIGDLVVDELFAGFYQTWQNARADNRVPSRQDIRLRDFAQYAGNMIIFERRERRDFRARLVGGLIAERIIKYGREANLFKVFADDILHGADIWFNSLVDVPCAGFMEYSMTYLNGRCKACELLMLPVRDKKRRSPSSVPGAGAGSCPDRKTTQDNLPGRHVFSGTIYRYRPRLAGRRRRRCVAEAQTCEFDAVGQTLGR